MPTSFFAAAGTPTPENGLVMHFSMGVW